MVLWVPPTLNREKYSENSGTVAGTLRNRVLYSVKMDQLPLTLPNSPIPRRGRGRPPGAKNRRSLDLAKYVEATYGGMTPGQQAAALGLVTPKEIREARTKAIELGLVYTPRDPFLLAMVVKAAELAAALGCDRKDAWLLIQRERQELMGYVHQKQPQAAQAKPGERAMAFIVPEGQEGAAPLLELGDDADIEILEDLPSSSAPVSR